MTPRAGGRVDREAGSIALLVLAGGFVLLGVILVVLSAVTDVAAAAARARTAADAAALAAVTASPPLGAHGDPCEAAREVAEANGAALLRCNPDRVPAHDPLGRAVEVEVEVEPGAALTSTLTGPLPARAAAALAPDYQPSGP